MSIITPSWFAQRQGKAEEAGPDLYRLTGPNLRESFIGIRPAEHGQWLGFLRASADGPDEATAGPVPTQYDACQTAFEIFRNHIVN